MSQPAAAVPPTSVPGSPSSVAPASPASAASPFLGEGVIPLVNKLKDIFSQLGSASTIDLPQVSSGTVEKTTKPERRNKKKKEEKKKKKKKEEKKGSSSDPSATPPSAPENNRPIYFKYAEASMNLTIMVSEGFDARPESLEMKQLCFQASNEYCRRLGIPSEISDMNFNFMALAPDEMLVYLKDDKMGLGFEDQVKSCRTSLADSVVRIETLEQPLRSVEAQLEADSEMLQSRVSVLEGENRKKADLIKELQETKGQQEHRIEQQDHRIEQQDHRIEQQDHRIEQLQETIATQGSFIGQLLKSAELQYKARQRVLLERARQKLLDELQKSLGNLTWKEFIESLSEDEKSRSGASTLMLLEMGTGKSSLNKALHQDGSLEEMAHAVNTISSAAKKATWQDLFIYVYEKHPDEIDT